MFSFAMFLPGLDLSTAVLHHHHSAKLGTCRRLLSAGQRLARIHSIRFVLVMSSKKTFDKCDDDDEWFFFDITDITDVFGHSIDLLAQREVSQNVMTGEKQTKQLKEESMQTTLRSSLAGDACPPETCQNIRDTVGLCSSAF